MLCLKNILLKIQTNFINKTLLQGHQAAAIVNLNPNKVKLYERNEQLFIYSGARLYAHARDIENVLTAVFNLRIRLINRTKDSELEKCPYTRIMS